MAIKTIRVFAEYTSDGYVPMPSQGNIDYGITIGNSFPETQPSSYQTDDPNIDVAVNTMTDFYVWIRTHGSPWNPSYTRVVRVYPDSPSINSVVMNMIVAVGSGGTSINAGGGVTYYLNGGTSQGVLDGSTYYEMSKTPVEGAMVDFFKINTTGFQNIAQFVTDAGDPSLLKIPPGAWPLGFYFSASDNSGNPRFYAEIYKYSQAGVFTLLGSSVASPEVISNGVAIDYYTTTVTIPDTTLLITDRIAIRIFVDTDGNRTVNFHTQDSHLASVGTTFANGLTAINGLTKQVQFIAIGNAGSDAAIVSSDDTHTINLPTASATKRGLLNNTDWSTFNSKQAALSGTGFVKIDGSTISYDNSSYQPLDGDLTAIGALAGNTGILKKTGANTWELDTTTYLSTGVAADTYQRKDKMVSNLLASDTEYPNSNAVLAKLALKADIANPQFTGSMNIKGAESRINFYDEADAIKYFIGYDSGFLRIYQNAGSASRFYINSDGKTFIPGILEAGTIIKTGGTASQFLKADGSVDANTYITSGSLSNYLLSATAASTYQRLDKMVSNLLASDTEYPNSNAVLAALALKANAANPTFTGDFTISGATPRLYFVDTDNNPDYTLFTDSGYFYIYDQTAGATRFSINSSGNATFSGSITSSLFVNAFEFSFLDTVFNPSAASRTTIDSMSIKMYRNYFNGTGLGSDYGTILQYYSQSGHVESQVYFDAGGGSWYRTASYNANYGSWQRYLTDANYSLYSLPLSGGTVTGTLTISATGGLDTATNDVYASMRVIRNNKASGPGNDGMYIGYENSNSGITRIFGGGSTSGGLVVEGAGNNSVKINGNIVLNAANYTSYSPSLTGYGASGTWGIDINGASNRAYRGIIEDTRAGQRTPNNYDDYRVSYEFTNQIVSGWHTVTTMQGWHDGYAAWQIIGPSDSPAHENWYLRSGVNTTWNSLRTIIHSGNIGAQSVTYADNAGAVGTVGESRIVYGENSTATTSISNSTLNGALKSGFYTVGSGGIPNATGVNFVLHTAYAGVGNLAGFDLACNDDTSSSFYLRPATGAGKGAWQTVMTSANIGYQSVSYALTAGILNPLANYVWNNSSAATTYNMGITASFVRSEVDGFPSYGSVMTVRTYGGGVSGGTLQLYTPYSYAYGGDRLRFRFMDYVNSAWTGWKYLLNNENDPYAFNMNQYVRTTDDVTHQNLYVNSWFRNNTANSGLYNQALDTHFYSSDITTWNLATAGSTYISLALRPSGHNTAARGYLYANTSNEVGILNNSGSWALRIQSDLTTNLHGNLVVGYGKTLSSIYMYDGDENTREIHCNSNRIGFLNQSSSWGAWCNDDGSWEATNIYSTNGFINNADVAADKVWGLWFNGYNSTSYAIYREAGAWNWPYPDLRIAFHTGISIGANAGYGGIRFFNDYNMATSVFYVNNLSYGGENNVYAFGTMTASAFYESSDSRLKDLIEDDVQVKGIEDLKAKLYIKNGKQEYGYFAQEAETYMPSAVTRNADGYLNLSYREVHTAKISRLEKRVAELEKQLNVA